jgi:hypothetical protein
MLTNEGIQICANIGSFQDRMKQLAIIKVIKMVYAIFLGKVQDFDKWKTVYDKDKSSLLKAAGAKSGRVLRGLVNPKSILVIIEFENLEMAKNFAESDILKDRMQLGGVVGRPDIHFAEEIENINL